METTYAAALAVIRQSIEMFREALRGLPDDAMDWIPAAAMSPLSVLVAHNCSSLRFFAGCGAGRVSSIGAYREGARAAAFRARGLTAAAALQECDAAESDVAALLQAAGPADLEATIRWPEEPGMVMSGAEALLRSVGHLREHVGHAQLMRDLWQAGHPS